jgi:hypothetical protein
MNLVENASQEQSGFQITDDVLVQPAHAYTNVVKDQPQKPHDDSYTKQYKSQKVTSESSRLTVSDNSSMRSPHQLLLCSLGVKISFINVICEQGRDRNQFTCVKKFISQVR